MLSDGKLIFAETLLQPFKNKYTEFLEKAKARKKEEMNNLKENIEKLKNSIIKLINIYHQTQSFSLESEYSILISEVEKKLNYISRLETTNIFEANEEKKVSSEKAEGLLKKDAIIKFNSNFLEHEEKKLNKMNINDPSLSSKNLINDKLIKNDSSSFSSSKPTNISPNSAQATIHSENKDLPISFNQPFVQQIRSIYDKIEGYKRVFEKEIRYFASFVGTKRKKVPHDSYKMIVHKFRNILKCNMLVLGGREGGEKGVKIEGLREIKVEEGGTHGDWVNAVVMLDSEEIVATGSSDCSIKIWNIQTFECVRIIFGHSSSVLSLVFFPLKKTLLSGSKDGSVKIWDYSKGTLIKTFDALQEGVRSLIMVRREGEERKEEGGGRSKEEGGWRREGGERKRKDVGGREENVKERLRKKSEEEEWEQGKRWQKGEADEEEGESIEEEEEDEEEEEEKDDWMVVGGGSEGEVRVWDYDGKVVNKMDCHREAINCMMALEGKDGFLTGSNDGLIKQFTFFSSYLRQTSSFSASSPVKSLCPLDQRQFLSGSKDGQVKLWNLLTGVCQRSFDLNGSSVNGLMRVKEEKG